ncbi:uncharacterized protein CTHT_0018100 [Thermochaetoides thermophila DSM 1495]|uniref:Uncharacterized protein n=1 Tax=Chaetomium thermophilum (strain DSM 1495 / CBS 144.50 / IMI 039719) TaxID=759272 RepID=G0S2Q6_CHATD|nr:hypothetical protein CTHT_0018100 [Thermochaetoides thermophila DSM 1495]EGS22289.1 hypothetical protein CTHT_0018100 [Thermochaetoides thermophila DSM 1495]
MVYRKLCKEAKVNFYRERISAATSSAEWEGCMALGLFPKAFKQATVITLSKPGRNPRSYKSWQPITILSTFGKGVERLLTRRMTAAALCSGLLPLDVAGAIPSRSALDLVQSLVHDAETMARQGYHGLLVNLDIDSAYPSVQPSILREVLRDQG